MDLSPFSFNGQLFVVEVNGKEFGREESASLHRLLNQQEPQSGGVVTKTGSVQSGSTFKDQPVDFYRAQLLHYGLPDRKTKEAAKKALLKAYGTSKRLPIPSQLRDYEKELKSYATAGKKRKAENQPSGSRQGGGAAAMSRTQLLKEIEGLSKPQLRTFLQKVLDNTAGLEDSFVRCLGEVARPTKRAKTTATQANDVRVLFTVEAILMICSAMSICFHQITMNMHDE